MKFSRLSCKEASRLQSQAMDRSLTIGERVSLRLHTTACEACTRVGRQFSALRRALRQYPGPGNDDLH